jgi:DNA-binding NarL/FixJ family response regulator
MKKQLTGPMEFDRHVLVVEDDEFVRGLIAHTLGEAGFGVTSAGDVVEAGRAFDDCDPDALVVDIHLGPGPTGMELAHSLKARSPGVAILAISNYPTAASAGIAAELPDDAAFICKKDLTSGAVLVEAVEAVLRNSRLDIMDGSEIDSPLARLTTSQLAVLRLMAEGWTNGEIASQRGATLRSVEQMSHRIFLRLGVNDDARKSARIEAVKIYSRAFGIPDLGN